MDKGGASTIFQRSEREACGTVFRFGSGAGQGSWVYSHRVLRGGSCARVCAEILVVKYGLREERSQTKVW